MLDQLENYYSFEGTQLEEIKQAVKDEVLTDDWDGALIHAAANFTYEFETGESCKSCNGVRAYLCTKCDGKGNCKRKFQFDSCELPDGKVYSYHFIWCCYAIVWGIQQYDAKTAGRTPMEVSS